MKSALSVDALPGISNLNIIFLKCDFTVTRAREPVKELFELNNAKDQSILNYLFWRLFAKNIGVNELHFKSAAQMHEASSEGERNINRRSPWITRKIAVIASTIFSVKRPRVTPSKSYSRVESCKYLFFNVTMHSILKSNLRKFSMYTTLLTRLSSVTSKLPTLRTLRKHVTRFFIGIFAWSRQESWCSLHVSASSFQISSYLRKASFRHS